jgi:TnpA family transposase
MKKITRQIATILQNKIDNEVHDLQNSGLSAEQADSILKFVNSLSRNSPFFPYPLKHR